MVKKKELAEYEITTKIIEGRVQTDITCPYDRPDAQCIALLREHTSQLLLNAQIMETRITDEPECCSD